MLKSHDKHYERAVRYCALTCLILTLYPAAASLGQQAQPLVAAKIDETNGITSKRTTELSAAAVVAIPEGFENLKLAPGYLLQMDIYNVPEMSAELRIDAQGFVTVPLVGPIPVAGKTCPQAQTAIAKVLVDQEILKNPQVMLNVLQFSPKNVSVLGEVQSPGRIQLLSAESLGDVLALAGGETIAAGDDIEIQRASEGGQVVSEHIKYVQGEDPSVLQSIQVNPGDTVLVHRAGVIYVLGAVNRAGGYLMVHGGSLSVIEAVSLAGGTTIQAGTRWAVIVRREGSGFVQFKVPLGKMEIGEAAPVQLELGDALYVPLSTWKAVLVNGSNVLSSATSAAIYRAP